MWTKTSWRVMPWRADMLAEWRTNERAHGVSALVGIAVLMAACAGAAGPRPGSVPRTNLVTGSTGSTWYTIGSALAEKANLQFTGYPVTAVPGAGGVSNPVRVSMTGTDLGISYGPFLRAAYLGERPFRESLPQLRVVAVLVLNTLHVIANESLGFHAVTDLRDLDRAIRLGSGPPGSGELFCVTALLDLFGTNLDQWRDRGNLLRLSGTTQRFEDWSDARLDVAVTFINDPSPQLTELMLTRPGRLLSVPQHVRDELKRRWGFVEIEVAANTYPNQPYSVQTVGLPSILFAVDGTHEPIVYALTKALYENQSYLRKVQPAFARWEPRQLPNDLGLPFHAGALRYYREAGIDPSVAAVTSDQAR
jgi:TRAP transporter TAXI family solute receptor